MFMWAQSDRGIPRSYRMMQGMFIISRNGQFRAKSLFFFLGFGVNTYTLTNAEGALSYVKFHYTPELGVHSFGR